MSKTIENVLISFNSNYSAIHKTITQIFLITDSVLTKLFGFKRYHLLRVNLYNFFFKLSTCGSPQKSNLALSWKGRISSWLKWF